METLPEIENLKEESSLVCWQMANLLKNFIIIYRLLTGWLEESEINWFENLVYWKLGKWKQYTRLEGHLGWWYFINNKVQELVSSFKLQRRKNRKHERLD